MRVANQLVAVGQPQEAESTMCPRQPLLLAEGHVTYRRWRPFPFAFDYPMRLVGSWHRDDIGQPDDLPARYSMAMFCRGAGDARLPARSTGVAAASSFPRGFGRHPADNETVLHLACGVKASGI